MEFYEVIDKRRTVREFLDREVDFEVIKRILEAAYKAPTWNHNRNWHYIILKTPEEKEAILEYAKKEAGKFNEERYLNMPRPYPITLGQKMFARVTGWKYLRQNLKPKGWKSNMLWCAGTRILGVRMGNGHLIGLAYRQRASRQLGSR